MKNSSLSGCGYRSSDLRSSGLWLGSDGDLLAYNNISNGHYGVIVEGGRCVLTNNTISSNNCGLLIGSSGAVVENNTICYNDMGIDAGQSGLSVIAGNNISHNTLYGLLLGGNAPKKLSGNDIMRNGEGLALVNVSNCAVTENRLDRNDGHGLLMENARIVSIKNNTVSSNGWGLYINASSDVSIHNVAAMYNSHDGAFVNNSRNIAFIGNNASYNDGFGFNVTDNNTNVAVDKKRNDAAWNTRGDFNVPQAALSIAEISLMSLLIASMDKLIYLVDFQKVLMTNVFSGIVNPMREPLSKELDRLSHRLLAAFPVKRRGYSMAHVSSHKNALFFHTINGKDIRGAVRVPMPGKLSSHEIVLQQIRFFDLLLRDRVMLLRNVLYMAIMMGAGIVVYTAQVWIGTYDLPYFLPLALQFLVMFPIGLAVQGNVVGHVEKLDYDVRDEASIGLLREDALRKKAALVERSAKKKISDKKFNIEMKALSDALRAIDHMDVRRHYLLFTPDGLTKAVSGFEALLEKSPDEPLFLSGAAEAYAMLGRSVGKKGEDGRIYYEKALAAAQKAYSIDPGRFEVRRALAMSLYYGGQTESAKAELAEALRLHPGDAESYLLKAIMAADAGERQKLFDRAVSLNKDLLAAVKELDAVAGQAQKILAPEATASIKR
jgi:parallel beta-helix repeat protein